MVGNFRLVVSVVKITKKKQLHKKDTTTLTDMYNRQINISEHFP